MYDAKVINVMIGCPSDITEEINLTKKAIYEWNDNHSHQRKIVLVPLHWATNTYPSLGDRTQAVINKQMTDISDILVCIFGTKIGSSTGKYESGTIEEINEHIDANKPVMIYFKNFIEDLGSLDSAQLDRVSNFKTQIKNGALYYEYESIPDFEKIIKNHIEKAIYDVNTSLNLTPTITIPNNPQFNKKEIELLQNWVNSENIKGIVLAHTLGKIYLLGNTQYDIKNGKEEVEWNDMIERFHEAQFIELGLTKKGDRSFKLRKAAYDYINSLEEKD